MSILQPHLQESEVQIRASIGLFQSSKLIIADVQANELRAVPKSDFDQAWGETHPTYGRLIHWILFSAGAEYLVKGVCLAHQLGGSRTFKSPPPPPEPIDGTWISTMIGSKNSWSSETTLPLLNEFTQTGGILEQLAIQKSASSSDRDRLRAAFLYLQGSIRNRDVHGYVPNVRDDGFRLVQELFVPEFNRLISWVPSSISIWQPDDTAEGPKATPAAAPHSLP